MIGGGQKLRILGGKGKNYSPTFKIIIVNSGINRAIEMFDESICLNHCKLMGGRGGEGVESHMHYPMAFSILHNNIYVIHDFKQCH